MVVLELVVSAIVVLGSVVEETVPTVMEPLSISNPVTAEDALVITVEI